MINNRILARFQLTKHHSTLAIEALAGLTCYFTCAYIIFINPAILSTTGMDKGSVFTATCLITAFGTMLIGLLANVPVTIAPGMALNTFFAYVVVKSQGFDWHNALGMVFLAGIGFLMLTITKVRRLLIDALPHNIKLAIPIGISLLIALIALKNNQIVVSNADTLMRLGDITDIKVLLFFIGFLLIIAFDYFRVPGGLLLSILLITAISLLSPLNHWQGIFALPPSLKPTFFQLKFNQLESFQSLKPMFAFLLIALFDATGTFIGLLNLSAFNKGLANNAETIERGLLADSVSNVAASLVGSSSTSPFIESAAAIEAGGRTGLSAMITGLLFILSLFFYPLANTIPAYAVGPVLLYVALCMMKNVTQLKTDNITELAPAILTVLFIPYSFSIADGIGIGIITHTLLKCLTAKFNQIHPLMLVLSLIFISYFI